MKAIEPYYTIESEIDNLSILKFIERVGRTCYKSEDKITNESAIKFVQNIMNRKHEAIIEHVGLTVRFICDRGVTHEIVRHRLFSYAQESTRYCNYSQDKFDNQLSFIKPLFWENNDLMYSNWVHSMEVAEVTYLSMIKAGASPQEARSILPNSLKTEIVVTGNLREWRHFLKLRTDKSAHPQMRQLTIPLLKELQSKIPVIFDDIQVN